MMSGERGGSAGVPDHGREGDTIDRHQPPHIRRLIDAMRRLFDDASNVAGTLRRREPLPSPAPSPPHLSPIRCGGSEELFEHADATGGKLYSTYYFTQDFRTISPSAQYELYVLYGQVYLANALVNGNQNGHLDAPALDALKNALDAIFAKSAYFINFFRGYALSTAVLKGESAGESAEAELRAHVQDWVDKMDGAKRAMFRPERLADLVPHRSAQFVLAAAGPYRDGQRVINGVHFTREHAEPLLRHIADEQAKALVDR